MRPIWALMHCKYKKRSWFENGMCSWMQFTARNKQITSCVMPAWNNCSDHDRSLPCIPKRGRHTLQCHRGHADAKSLSAPFAKRDQRKFQAPILPLSVNCGALSRISFAVDNFLRVWITFVSVHACHNFVDARRLKWRARVEKATSLFLPRNGDGKKELDWHFLQSFPIARHGDAHFGWNVARISKCKGRRESAALLYYSHTHSSYANVLTSFRKWK